MLNDPDDRSRSSKQACDWCRTQKVKCNPLGEEDAGSARLANLEPCCQRCYRRKERCTFKYTMKKPGRPSNDPSHGARHSRSASPDPTRRGNRMNMGSLSETGASGANEMLPPGDRIINTDAPPITNAPSSLNLPLAPSLPSHASLNTAHAKMVEQSILPSSTGTPIEMSTDDLLSALRQSTPQFNFPPDHLANATLPLNNANWASYAFRLPEDQGASNGSATETALFDTPSTTIQPPSDNLSTSIRDSPSDAAVVSSVKLNAEPGDFMPIDVVAPWSDICFFISLHMRHQHSLVPIVHRPSFANDMLHRRDQKDETFRGCLASMVAYVICQSPMNLVGKQHTRERLKRILFRAHRFSRACQLRNSHQPTLFMLASVILDYISTQATDDVTSTDMLAAEARRLVYRLRINQAEPREGMSLIEKQICYRMYWEVIAVEKTAALNGAPIMLHEMDGVPPLPIAVDDEYISEEHNFPQPTSKRSYMTGFIIVAKMFRILGQCLQRHRMFLHDPGTFENTEIFSRWIEDALADLRALTEGVPIPSASSQASSEAQADEQSWWGIQCANIHITALCAEIACIDFRSVLMPNHDLPSQRHIIAKKAYDVLTSIPIECLASNGQSLRGKILRVVLSLLTLAPDSEHMSAHVWDWWNLYHSIQFIQAVPENPD